MNWRRYLPYFALWIAILAAYSNVYGNQFFYDDEFLIVKNMYLRDWSGLFKVFLNSSTGGSGGVDSFYRPMQSLLYVVVYQLFGLSTVAFHALNVLIHAGNAMLLFSLGKRLRFSERAAFCAALLWSLHPVHVEAVTYMSATADGLYTFFILLGLVFFVDGRLFALGAMLLALLSKESAVVFPALTVAVVFFLNLKRWQPKTYLKTLPYWALALLYMLARKTVLNFDNTFNFYRVANIYTENIWYRFLTFLATLPSYARVLLLPFDLHFDRTFSVYISIGDLAVLLGLGIALIALFCLWFERKKERPLASFAVLWFAAAHTPHSGVLLPVNSLFLEHWLYLPTLGLFLSVGEVLPKRWIVAPIVALFWGTLTYRQNEFWASPISFYERVLKYETKVSRVHNNLAMAYSDAGQDELAILHYKTAIELYDIYPQTHHNLGLSYVRRGDLPAAKAQFLRALELDPDFFQSAYALAQVFEHEGDAIHARQYMDQAAKSAAKRGGSL